MKVVNPEFFGCATLGSPIYRVQKYLQGPVRSAQSVWQLPTHQTLHGKVPGSRAAQGQWVCQILVRRKRSGPCGREFNDLARATRVSPFYHFSTSHILQETLVFRLWPVKELFMYRPLNRNVVYCVYLCSRELICGRPSTFTRGNRFYR